MGITGCMSSTTFSMSLKIEKENINGPFISYENKSKFESIGTRYQTWLES